MEPRQLWPLGLQDPVQGVDDARVEPVALEAERAQVFAVGEEEQQLDAALRAQPRVRQIQVRDPAGGREGMRRTDWTRGQMQRGDRRNWNFEERM